MRGQRGVGGLLPQADRDPRPLASGAAGALGSGGAAGALGDEAGEPSAAVIARAPRETRVDDDGDIVEGDAGLGDGAGQDQLASSGGGRGECSALRGGVDLAVEAVKDDAGRKLAKRGGGALDLGDPGNEREQRAGVLGQRAADRGGHLRLDLRGRVAADVVEGEGEAAAFALDQRRVSQQTGEAPAFESGGHGEEAQVGTKCACRVERQRDREVAVETALMDLVEQHRRDASEFGIGLKPGEEDAVGHDDYSASLADATVEAGGIADRRAGLLAQGASHIFGGGARG